jgi:selenocysteine lyase/cysteine desulfurase
VDYLGISGVTIGLAFLSSVGIDVIHERVRCLTGWLLTNLEALRHHNERWVVQMHGPAGLENRGGTISFNFHDVNGAAFDMARVQELASAAKISLRTGCFCNPGAGEAAFGLSAGEIRDFFHQGRGLSFESLRRRIHDQYGKDIGALRVSVGLATNFADVYRFVEFARGFIDRSFADVGTAAGSHARDGA